MLDIKLLNLRIRRSLEKLTRFKLKRIYFCLRPFAEHVITSSLHPFP